MLEEYECPECKKDMQWDDQCEDQYMICPHCNSKLRSPVAAAFSADTIIGDYKIIKRLGIGGMGEVYLAEQLSMMRPVALKVLQSSLVEDKSYLERFYREVRTLAQIEHPNIVKAIETGYIEEGNICYFSMRYIEGEDLKRRLDKEGKIEEIDALNVIMHVGLALQHVWDRYKLIHRDIKPANIIVTSDGEVQLMDLGISKSMLKNSPADLTMAGMMVGSPYYVSPEQARAEKDLDFSADMYSLGASFYHMITGVLPFDSDNAMAIIASHLRDPLPNPQKYTPSLSKNSANIIYKMMEKERKDRYKTWDDALNDVENAINEISQKGKGKETSLQPAVNLRTTQIREIEQGGLNKKPPSKKEFKVLNNIKKGALGRIFNNLYIRFVILVLLLFLTFIAFFSVIKSSIKEAKNREASRRLLTAETYFKRKPKTKKGFNESYKLFMMVKKVGVAKYSQIADKKIIELQTETLKFRDNNQKELAKRVLLNLKNRSDYHERARDYNSALQVWRRYRRDGHYAKELEKDIDMAMKFLKKSRDKYNNIGVN